MGPRWTASRPGQFAGPIAHGNRIRDGFRLRRSTSLLSPLGLFSHSEMELKIGKFVKLLKVGSRGTGCEDAGAVRKCTTNCRGGVVAAMDLRKSNRWSRDVVRRDKSWVMDNTGLSLPDTASYGGGLATNCHSPAAQLLSRSATPGGAAGERQALRRRKNGTCLHTPGTLVLPRVRCRQAPR